MRPSTGANMTTNECVISFQKMFLICSLSAYYFKKGAILILFHYVKKLYQVASGVSVIDLSSVLYPVFATILIRWRLHLFRRKWIKSFPTRKAKKSISIKYSKFVECWFLRCFLQANRVQFFYERVTGDAITNDLQ